MRYAVLAITTVLFIAHTCYSQGLSFEPEIENEAAASTMPAYVLPANAYKRLSAEAMSPRQTNPLFSIKEPWLKPITFFIMGTALVGPRAFASTHTTMAFAVNTIASQQYHGKCRAAVYKMGSLTDLSRSSGNFRWHSGAVAGGLLGYFCGYTIFKSYRKFMANIEQRATTSRSISVHPDYTGYYKGILINYNF